MKRFTYIFAVFLLVGCLFISTGILSKSLLMHHPAKKGLSYEMPSSYNPNLLNTFNYLFPIYSFDREVCRKPVDYGSSLLKMNYNFSFKGYKYNGFFEKSQSFGTHFLHVEGNNIYKSGNSFLLIPHSYVMPVSPSYNSKMPRMVIPKSN